MTIKFLKDSLCIVIQKKIRVYDSHGYDGHGYSHNDGSLCDDSSKMRKFGIKKNSEDSEMS